MRRELGGGLELDDDKARIDRAEVHRFLSAVSYWATGRRRETQDRLIDGAARVVGVYDGDRQIGFARAATDGVSFVYLADVYLLEEYRGRGLGGELVREMVENGPLAHLKWLLHTSDMHSLYRKFGFDTPGRKVMERLPAEILSGGPGAILGAVEPDDLRLLQTVGAVTAVDAGHVLIERGQPGTGLYVVLEGSVLVEAPEGTRTLGAGSVIGERALLSPDGTRTARVRTTEPARVLAVDRAAFDELCAGDPDLARRVSESAES
jgi:GNAT superfamily N-acetyltransferase